MNDDDVCGVFWVEVSENEECVMLLRLEVEHYLWMRLVMLEIAEVSVKV